MRTQASTLVSIIVILAGLISLLAPALGIPTGHRGTIYGIVLIAGGLTRLWMNRRSFLGSSN